MEPTGTNQVDVAAPDLPAENCCGCAKGRGYPDSAIAGNRVSKGGGRPVPPRSVISFLAWMVPGALLALLPKCPVCVVGYAVIGASVGSSLSVQAELRQFVLIACVVALSLLSLVYIGREIVRATLKDVSRRQDAESSGRSATGGVSLKGGEARAGFRAQDPR